MKMQVVVGIDETAGQAGRAERLPLPGDFITDPAAVGWSEGEQDSGSVRGTAPGPIGLGQGTRVAEVQVPADLQDRMRPGQCDRVRGASLPQHQTGPRQRAVLVRPEDGEIDGFVQPEVVGDEKHRLHLAVDRRARSKNGGGFTSFALPLPIGISAADFPAPHGNPGNHPRHGRHRQRSCVSHG